MLTLPVIVQAESFRSQGSTPAVAALYQQLATNPDQAQIWRKLGLQLRAEGQLRAALGPLQRALSLDLAANDRPHIAIGYTELAHLFQALANRVAGDDPARQAKFRRRAVAAFIQAVDMQTAIGNPLALARNLRALARLQRASGQPAEAAQNFARAADAFIDARRVTLAAETRAEAGF